MLPLNSTISSKELCLSSRIFLNPNPDFTKTNFLVLFAKNGSLSSGAILDALTEPNRLFQLLEEEGVAGKKPELIISSQNENAVPRYIYVIPKSCFPVQSSVDAWSVEFAKTLYGLKQKNIGIYIPKGLLSPALQYQILFEMISVLASYKELPHFHIYKGANSYHEWLNQLIYLKKDLQTNLIDLEIFH